MLQPDLTLYVSAISAFEISIKHRKGKLQLPLPPRQWFLRALSAYPLTELPVTSEVAGLAPEVDAPHSDPCDRIIMATAQIHGIPILTPDSLIAAAREVTVIW